MLLARKSNALTVQIRFRGAQPESGDNDHTMFRVIVLNEGGANAVGIWAVTRGGGVELGPMGRIRSQLAEWATTPSRLAARHSNGTSRAAGAILGPGELVAEIQDAEGRVLETYPMPRQSKR